MGDEIIIRPDAYTVLLRLSKYFELYLFTAAHKTYADPIIDAIDPHRILFKNRFYRESCVLINQHRIKDLRIFSDRELSQVIIVDNSVISFAFQINNGIPIQPYLGSKQDYQLLYLMQFLMSLRYVNDVRNIFKTTFSLQRIKPS
jgi:Dullard-like phosphatase family protein